MSETISEDEAAERAGLLYQSIREVLGNQPFEVVSGVLVGLVSTMVLGSSASREAALEMATAFREDVEDVVEGYFKPVARPN